MFFSNNERRMTVAYHINPNQCLVCGSCADDCPLGIIAANGNCYVIDADQCIDCGSCALTCPVEAIAPAE